MNPLCLGQKIVVTQGHMGSGLASGVEGTVVELKLIRAEFLDLTDLVLVTFEFPEIDPERPSWWCKLDDLSEGTIRLFRGPEETIEIRRASH